MSRWKRCMGRGMGEGVRAPMPSLGAPLSQHLPPRGHHAGGSQKPVLLGLYGGFIMLA